MRKLSQALEISAACLLVLLAVLPTITIADSSSGVVSIIGDEGFNANSRIFATFRFSPGHIEIAHGGVLTLENIVTNEPHTISLVRESDLPTNINQVFMCGAPGTVCAAISAAHIPNGFGPNGQPNPPVIPFVNVSGNPSGFEQGNVQGNSLLIRPGQTASLTVSAQSGTTLHFICIIHPWMQAEIVVK